MTPNSIQPEITNGTLFLNTSDSDSTKWIAISSFEPTRSISVDYSLKNSLLCSSSYHFFQVQMLPQGPAKSHLRQLRLAQTLLLRMARSFGVASLGCEKPGGKWAKPGLTGWSKALEGIISSSSIHLMSCPSSSFDCQFSVAKFQGTQMQYSKLQISSKLRLVPPCLAMKPRPPRETTTIHHQPPVRKWGGENSTRRWFARKKRGTKKKERSRTAIGSQ